MHSHRHHHRYSLSLILTLLATTLTTSEAYAAKSSSAKPKPKPGATGKDLSPLEKADKIVSIGQNGSSLFSVKKRRGLAATR